MLGRMAEKKSFRVGQHVTLTVPEAVADQVSAAFAEALGRGSTARRARTLAAERLSADRIVEAAIEQMRERGYDAVTMRSIAKALGTGPASLYAHVANRAELDRLVVDRVASQWQLPDPDPRRWQDQLRRALHDLLGLYRAHPGVARCSMGTIPTTTGTLIPTERMLALLRAGGVADQHAAWFVDVVVLYVAAVAIEEDIWRARAADSVEEHTEEYVVGQVRTVFQALPSEHFPLLRSMAVPLTTGSAEERFAFGVDLLVGGLSAMARA